ncbi:39S ribosomal protein L35-like protein [Leptotrombidium deliense]|uniref:39S ribosomal protein L35-like protein n=1 Tax=Leptotrombidium deliense TaxID=299467 RepID=A0A443SFG3_9ACAR|nr:39S ribosomal protein L35-like protein [Leptotrombidium deliense]
MAMQRLTGVCNLFANALKCAQQTCIVPSRSVIYYDFHNSRRRSVTAAIQRFHRLNWGGWVYMLPGGRKKVWRKSWWRRWYDRQYYLLSPKQSWEMEQLMTPRYKKPKYFVDDPFEPYQKRHGLDFVPLGANGLEAKTCEVIAQQCANELRLKWYLANNEQEKCTKKRTTYKSCKKCFASNLKTAKKVVVSQSALKLV